jgi:hypothetical protein
MLNMFRTLIPPSSGACDFSIVSPHWSCVLVSMCVGVSVWLGWGGVRVADWILPLALWICEFESRQRNGCLSWVLCVVRYRSWRRTDHSSRGVLLTVLRRDPEISRMRRSWPSLGCRATRQKMSVTTCSTTRSLQPATRTPPQPSHTETPTYIETRTHDQCGNTIEKSQAPDDWCINVRNILIIEEAK